jgi:hypothetical protein
MSQLKTTVKCAKDLFHADGSKSFSKGQTYEGNICNVTENLTVTNDQGEPHRIGSQWAKHFKNISKY